MSRFFLVDTNFHASPAAVDADTAAVGLWVLLGSWSANQRTNGLIPRRGCPVLDDEDADAWIDELLRVKLLHEHEDGWVLGHGKQDWYTAYSFIAGDYRPRIPKDLRQKVYARDGHQCVVCGTTENLSLDHIYPWSKGGKDTFENLQTMCRPHNSAKGAKV